MPSSDSVKIISLDRARLLADLGQAARKIHAEHPEVAEVRLFGSLARGDHTGTSDVDVLILLHHTLEGDPVQRIVTFFPYFDLGRACDLLVYTVEELQKRLSASDRTMQRIWSESVLLL